MSHSEEVVTEGQCAGRETSLSHTRTYAALGLAALSPSRTHASLRRTRSAQSLSHTRPYAALAALCLVIRRFWLVLKGLRHLVLKNPD